MQRDVHFQHPGDDHFTNWGRHGSSLAFGLGISAPHGDPADVFLIPITSKGEPSASVRIVVPLEDAPAVSMALADAAGLREDLTRVLDAAYNFSANPDVRASVERLRGLL